MTAAPTLSYATPRPPSRFLLYYLVFLCCTIIPAAVLFFLTLFYIPRFSAIFAQFGGELPLLTRCVLNLAHLTPQLLLLPLWLILLAALPLLPARLCATQENPRRRTAFLITFLLAFLLTFLLVLLLIIISMLLPIFQLQQLIH